MGDFRSLFPVLSSGVTYLDSAAKSLTPSTVVEAMNAFYRECDAAVDRSVHELARRADGLLEEGREAVARLVGASAGEIVFVRGTTEAIAQVAAGLSWKRGDTIVTTALEHHSNYLPWVRVARETGAALRVVKPRADGLLCPETVERVLRKERCRLLAFAHVSNALGTVQPVGELCRLARRAGALSLVDAAQAVPHLRVNARELGCDFLAWSGHKMFGPGGTGALWARQELLAKLRPLALGGGAMALVRGSSYRLDRQPPYRALEAGTRDTAGLIGFGAAANLLARCLEDDAMVRAQAALVDDTVHALRATPGVWVGGPDGAAERAGIVPFSVGGMSPHQVAAALDEAGILVRSGHHCAAPLMNSVLRRPEGIVRASFHWYSNQRDASALVEAVASIAREARVPA